MNISDQSAINNSRRGVRVDFQYFMQSAINQELSWKTLEFFLIDLTTTPEKSKEVIKILVEELEKWVTKTKNGDNNAIDENDKDTDTVKENMIYSEGSVNEVNGDYNQFDCDFNQENKSTNEKMIENEIESEPSDGDKMQDLDHNESMSSSQERIQCLSIKEKLNDKVDAFKDELYTFVGSDPENDEEDESSRNDDINESMIGSNIVVENQDQLHESKPIQDTKEPQDVKKLLDLEKCIPDDEEFNHNGNEVLIVDGKRMFKCKTCGKIVKHIRVHMEIHAGIKNYKCTTCQKGCKMPDAC